MNLRPQLNSEKDSQNITHAPKQCKICRTIYSIQIDYAGVAQLLERFLAKEYTLGLNFSRNQIIHPC